ncbi:MAG: 4-hydroxythreonine-4-phosphate dehydrogenase PdxA [Rhodospirillaceae bacterium]|nr:4-hydroxythreonine-4-phosphate dehydrogenase PdxA [Rhodospirillaceae bacterium]
MLPKIGVLLGDPCGIGPELVAKLLADEVAIARARVLVIGDGRYLAAGRRVAGLDGTLPAYKSAEAWAAGSQSPALLDFPGADPAGLVPGTAMEPAGRTVLECLRLALALARAGTIDAICFAPFNKQAMHMAGLGFDDELQFVAHEIGFDGPVSEFNVLDTLWTGRVTSHIPLSKVSGAVTREGVVRAVRLIHDALRAAGIPRPRIGVAGLNPHAGDGGVFGREEIDVIAPAVGEAKAAGIAALGPFPADIIFRRAQAGEFDAVVSMYHDQGQIAMKLMGFERGVTVLGGLPIAVTTPAHGTAFDIVGRGIANPEAMRRAFLVGCRMAAERQRAAA